MRSGSEKEEGDANGNRIAPGLIQPSGPSRDLFIRPAAPAGRRARGPRAGSAGLSRRSADASGRRPPPDTTGTAATQSDHLLSGKDPPPTRPFRTAFRTGFPPGAPRPARTKRTTPVGVPSKGGDPILTWPALESYHRGRPRSNARGREGRESAGRAGAGGRGRRLREGARRARRGNVRGRRGRGRVRRRGCGSGSAAPGTRRMRRAQWAGGGRGARRAVNRPRRTAASLPGRTPGRGPRRSGFRSRSRARASAPR